MIDPKGVRWSGQHGFGRRAAAFMATLLGLLACVAAPARAASEREVVFSPALVQLDNPRSPGGAGRASSVGIDITAYDAQGQRIQPSADNPLHIEVSGAPRGAISPTSARLTSGSSATFAYDGSYVASPITLTAWIDQPGAGRKSLGRTLLLPANPVDCRYGAGSHTLRVLCADGGTVEQCGLDAIRRGLEVRAAVGHDDPRGHFQPFGVDTGSIGTVVPVAKLGPDAIGPGAPGSVYYDSSGRIFSGSYYLASVAFETEDGRVVKTPRMLVLGITSASCAPGHPTCRESDDPTLHYLGVGFARGTQAEHKLTSPADNAFLRLADGGDGSISPGYVLTGRAITIGISSTAGYGLASLAPSATAPGDWSPARACYAFPELPEPNRFCGNFLLDVGLAQMFLDLPRAQRPPGSEVARRCGEGRECASVPEGTAMRVEVGASEAPAMSYDFTLRREPRGPEPTYAQWIDRSPTFINVGRRPLFRFHYLFDATCGKVGFAPVD